MKRGKKEGTYCSKTINFKLLKNVPYNYLDVYDPKLYFDTTYEFDEINYSRDNDNFPNEPPQKLKSSNTFQTKKQEHNLVLSINRQYNL